MTVITHSNLIHETIIRDLSEGVIVLGLDGQVQMVNPSATRILGIPEEELLNRKFASVFLKYRENDSFNQKILDAAYDMSSKHYGMVPYYTGTEFRQLYIMTSFLYDGETRIGITVVLSDITELAELKIRHAQQITELLDSMVQALSTAIDERSHYTANHTRNMVKLANAFLDWLERKDHPLALDEETRRAFIMSVWLHDVGKLTVPLSIMDKATRLGARLERVEYRFEKIHLLERIAMLEGRISRQDWEARERRRAHWLTQIRRLNIAGFPSEGASAMIEEIARCRYLDERGLEQPYLLEEELKNLRIIRGTLTDEERAIMQGHAAASRRILEKVSFPEDYRQVPLWASEHHELLNGTGYPQKMRGDMIPKEVRLLTILDIFEALTAEDRPYKKPLPPERALEILRIMVKEGSLDGTLLELFEQSRAWEADHDHPVGN